MVFSAFCINILDPPPCKLGGICTGARTNAAFAEDVPFIQILEYVLQEQIDYTGLKGSPNEPAKCFENVGVLGPDKMTGLWILNIHKK
ncbi:hypothetical protein E4U17_005091 [Claviceps sp. LM77 group G4]|nr:hypothetical protein E4U17_005091 [Claviceps sp. LM77 group G4]KAG6067898.1 hypothetical protein E4U33_005185 [Claviceps sp. LM78 group G4]KAG6075767.1 hypothetical protein E4U16_003163 [Claviceps sp. LM84 group G4]